MVYVRTWWRPKRTAGECSSAPHSVLPLIFLTLVNDLRLRRNAAVSSGKTMEAIPQRLQTRSCSASLLCATGRAEARGARACVDSLFLMNQHITSCSIALSEVSTIVLLRSEYHGPRVHVQIDPTHPIHSRARCKSMVMSEHASIGNHRPALPHQSSQST